MAYDETALLDAIAALVVGLANYDSTNVSIVDTKPLDAGVARAVILEEGQLSSPTDTGYMGYAARTTYGFLVRVYHKYTYDAETQANLRADVKEIRELLDGYHRLNSTAEGAKVISASAPQYVGTANGSGPYFMMRELVYQVVKLDAITLNE